MQMFFHGETLICFYPSGMHHTHSHKHARASTAQAPIHTGTTTMETHVHEHEHTAGGLEPHTLIGVSLCLGFVFMLLIDQISGGHSHGPSAGLLSILCVWLFAIDYCMLHNREYHMYNDLKSKDLQHLHDTGCTLLIRVCQLMIFMTNKGLSDHTQIEDPLHATKFTPITSTINKC